MSAMPFEGYKISNPRAEHEYGDDKDGGKQNHKVES